MIIPHYYENPLILHVGAMPVRSHYVPQSPDAGEAWDGRRSDRVVALDGEWMFRYFPSVGDLDDGIFGEGFDSLASGFSDPSFDPASIGFRTMPVPSVWQMNGYDRPQYVNERYPFPCDPPFVPVDDPCGLYRRTFDYHRNPDAPRAFLDFDGVDSCFFLWVNGTFVGYSQIAHATSEFEVTDRLVDGDNVIAVLVLKWCDGSYLEDQDKFRTSGIFRSVSLVTRPYCAVVDYMTTTDIEWGSDGSAKGATIGIGLRYLDDRPVTVSGRLLDADGHTIARAVPELVEDPSAATAVDGTFVPQARIVMHVGNPDLWTAETPHLYTLMLESPHEVIRDTVGIREVSVRDGVLLVNRQPVTLHGVNMHDSDPVTGPVVSEEDIMRDLVMMKRHNVNAIRTSHYPSSPYAYHLYDHLGFYVVSEADNEAHGAGVLIGDDMSDEAMAKRWNRPIADNPDFVEPIVDRVRHCVEREKNRPSVIIWSMGNESAYGRGFEAALRWTKTFDPTRLTHYESAIYTDGERSHSFGDIDIYSRMYPSVESIREHLSGDHADYGEGDDHPRRPYLLCEFCHAMGNGPGDLEDYFQVIDSHPRMAGGFVWEWCDHAIADGRGDNGRTRYLYGGDSGEVLHDGNFCVDGLVYPDRRPHVGLKEFANVFRPLRVASVDVRSRVLRLRSHLDFLDASELIGVELEVTVDGRTVGSVALGVPPIPARSTVAVTIPPWVIELVPDAGVCRFVLRYRLSRPWGSLPEETILGFDEVPVPTRDLSNVEARGLVEAAARRASSAGGVESMRSGRRLAVEGDGFRYVLDCGTGMFSSMTYRGCSMLSKPMEVNIWRAPTDNDIEVSKLWRRAGYDHASTRSTLLSVSDEDGALRIEVAMKIVAPGVQPIAEVRGGWLVRRDGSVDMSMDVHRTEGFPFLPRFGVRMFVPRSMDRIEYCGLGPRESYIDKRHSNWHGVFHGAPEDFVEPYPRPQENGNHHDCEWMSLSDGDMRMSVVARGRTFDGQVLPYTQEELAAAGHDCDLRRCEWNVVCVDYMQSGVGSNSCGPELARRYRLDAGDFRFSVGFVPEVL